MFTGLLLTGSVIATQTGQIATVSTVNYAPCGTTILNPPIPNKSSSPCYGFIENYFSAYWYVPLTFLNMASFTSSSNFAGAPISVIAGQIITATVNISFQ